MKDTKGYDKLRGGYYTPGIIAEFIVNWAVRATTECVLEPSCGDGSFLKAIEKKMINNGTAPDKIRKLVTGIELDKIEAEKASQYSAVIKKGDFFTIYNKKIEGKIKYDVIVGNPPFIRYQNFNEKYRNVAFALMKKHGFHPNRLTNIWLPFLVLSCKALSTEGRIGMVIPAELFQVDYAAETRLFLSSFFESMTLVTFKRLIFEGIQQEVVLLLGERTSDKKGIRVVELDGLDELADKGLACLESAELKTLDHSKEKWVKYYLTNEELALLSRLNNDERISDATDLYEVNVGLVSGENSFFIMNQQMVDKWNVAGAVLPIIGRAEQLKGILLSDEDYAKLVDDGKKVYFFSPGNIALDALDNDIQVYIRWGEQQGYHKNYKCKIRKNWYHVSQTWRAEAFLIRQANLYPKMIMNLKGAFVTDTLHKVRFLENVNGQAVTAAFLNIYTLALSETLGRSYGGGVLTFEPGEMRKFRIPMVNSESLDINKIDTWQREGRYEDILRYTDQVLLKDGLGMSNHEITLLHDIWKRMRDRRLGRKQG